MNQQAQDTKATRIIVTGANGFIGTALCSALENTGYTVRKSVRSLNTTAMDGDVLASGDISGETDWSAALVGMDVVVHLAARAHILHESIDDPLVEFRRVNTAGTGRLARQAAAAGVKRFIYISTIGVLGENTPLGKPFTETSAPNPVRPYAIAKWEAEQHLDQIRRETGMDIVIVRPPLVYGAHAPGNFRRLVKLVNTGVPLPFGSTNNIRSLVSLDNLVGFLTLCIQHPKASNECFLISDDEDLSTRQLIEQIARQLGKSLILVPIPESLIRLAARLAHQEQMVNQLWGSLAVDSSKGRALLGWTSVVSVDEGLRRAVQPYRAE